MEANMLAAYYDTAEDTSERLDNLFIQNCPSLQTAKRSMMLLQ